MIRIIAVSDDLDFVETLTSRLSGAGFTITRESDAPVLIAIISTETFGSPDILYQIGESTAGRLTTLIMLEPVTIPGSLRRFRAWDFTGTHLQPWQQLIGYLGSALERDENRQPITEHAGLYDDDPARRIAAAQRMSNADDMHTIAELMGALSDIDPNVRQAVIEALGRIGHQVASPRLLVMLQREQNSNMRAAVLTALGRMDDPNLLPVFSQYIDHANPYVREAALDALRGMHHVARPRFLRQLNATHWNDRRLAVIVLGRLGDADLAQYVIPMLEDQVQDVRVAAVQALAEIGDPDAIPALMHMLRQGNNKSWHVAGKVLYTLKALGKTDMDDALRQWKAR